MFAKALKSVTTYTRPVIISQKYYDGKVESHCASFIILNEEGWILTSAHILNTLLTAKKQKNELDEYEKRKAKLESDRSINRKKRKQMLRKLKPNNKWIINHSYWWGEDGVKVENFVYNQLVDLAAGKLEPFDSKSVAEYPILKNTKDELAIGTSLCKLGYPFHKIKTTFDEETGNFILEQGALPMPRFPIDGIYTRNAIFVDKGSNKEAKFIETSSPGLRGQSGGPIFDTNGNMWGLQSRTAHFPLGFSPKVKHGNKEVEEHQFINVGIGTHVEEIVNFLAKYKIKFYQSKNI